jgi:hypothetical protein
MGANPVIKLLLQGDKRICRKILDGFIDLRSTGAVGQPVLPPGGTTPPRRQWKHERVSRRPRFTWFVTLHLSVLPKRRVLGSADDSGADRTSDRAGVAQE